MVTDLQGTTCTYFTIPTSFFAFLPPKEGGPAPAPRSLPCTNTSKHLRSCTQSWRETRQARVDMRPGFAPFSSKPSPRLIPQESPPVESLIGGLALMLGPDTGQPAPSVGSPPANPTAARLSVRSIPQSIPVRMRYGVTCAPITCPHPAFHSRHLIGPTCPPAPSQSPSL
jgi:hypothetical protein